MQVYSETLRVRRVLFNGEPFMRVCHGLHRSQEDLILPMLQHAPSLELASMESLVLINNPDLLSMAVIYALSHDKKGWFGRCGDVKNQNTSHK